MRKLLILLALCPLLAQATDYYVSSSTGNDGNSGTSSSSPWKTLGKVNSHGLSAGDTCFLKSGDTFNGTISPASSSTGTAAAHIVFSTYGGTARAIISGFTTLTGGTQITGTNIYEFYCPSLTKTTNMLVMDGLPVAMGRWPDTGYRTYYYATGHSITDSTIPASPNWAGAWLVAHTEHYIIDTALIQSQSAAGGDYGGYAQCTQYHARQRLFYRERSADAAARRDSRPMVQQLYEGQHGGALAERPERSYAPGADDRQSLSVQQRKLL